MRQSASTIQNVVRNAKKMVDTVLSGNYGKLADTGKAVIVSDSGLKEEPA